MTKTTGTPTYTSFSVDVTYDDGRERQRAYKTEPAARANYDKTVAMAKATRVLLFGHDADGNTDGIDGWWGD